MGVGSFLAAPHVSAVAVMAVIITTVGSIVVQPNTFDDSSDRQSPGYRSDDRPVELG